MIRTDYPFGFRVLGGVHDERRVVLANSAFVGHCSLDAKSDPNRECYLSAFHFNDEFQTHMKRHSTPKHFAGPCWSPWLWFDIDRPDLGQAHHDTKRLVGFMSFTFDELDDDDILIFFSGNKGFHLGLPLVHNPEPSVKFNSICRRMAEGLAGLVPVAIDSQVYDRVRLFRAPNSRHAKSGRFKRRLTYDELMKLSTERIVELATTPEAFEVPTPKTDCQQLVIEWQAIEQALTQRPAFTPSGVSRLNRATLDFIREGADEGERTNRLFRAAGNLREFNAPPDLVHALLTEAALDSGLAPKEVERIIKSGIESTEHKGAQS